jgi:hypothetical protein
MTQAAVTQGAVTQAAVTSQYEASAPGSIGRVATIKKGEVDPETDPASHGGEKACDAFGAVSSAHLHPSFSRRYTSEKLQHFRWIDGSELGGCVGGAARAGCRERRCGVAALAQTVEPGGVFIPEFLLVRFGAGGD